jgi:hypothetical protein
MTKEEGNARKTVNVLSFAQLVHIQAKTCPTIGRTHRQISSMAVTKSMYVAD